MAWNEKELDEVLSRPSEALIEDMKQLKGDIMILGAGGKVGPTLSVMAKRAAEKSGISRRVIAVSRFSDPFVVELLKNEHVETISADLTDPDQIAKLPKVENIIFMLGRKFGTSNSACETWEINTAVPTYITRHFGAANYVVFSTGNVYPFSSLQTGACDESVAPNPVGEYGMSSLGRERIFEYAARHLGAKVFIYRLNYAIDLRYGVIYDIAKRIMNGEPVSLGNGAFNCIWQGYANEVAIRALLHTSSDVEIVNVTGPETVYVRDTAKKLGVLLNKEVSFSGTEGEMALLSNSQKCMRMFGYPKVGIAEMIALQAEWINNGGRQLDKPTHFEEQKGKF